MKIETGPSIYSRWMIRRDMHDVLAIARSTPAGWIEADFSTALRQRNVIGMVAEYETQVCGYMVYGLCKTEIALLDLAVRADDRRLGVGTLLVDKLKRKLTRQRRRRITIEVPLANLDGLRFLQAMGFGGVRSLDADFVDMEFGI